LIEEDFFLDVQNDLGVINNGLVYSLYDYEPKSVDDNELEFKDGDQLMILRRGDENESEWWWARHVITEKEGYIPRNYLGVSKRSKKDFLSLISSSCTQEYDPGQ
jgi:apoptosis-stimulating of p53 protein 1